MTTRASLIARLPDRENLEAWDEFVSLYGPLVYRLARRRGLQPADADDLVQEVFASVSHSVEQWLVRSERGPFRAWLLRIARNTAINFLTRRKHRSLGVGGSEAAVRLSEQPAADDDAEEKQFAAEYQKEVFRWASRRVQELVAETTWRAFHETAIRNRSAADVAAELGVSVGSVYISRSRVMSRMKELVRVLEEANDE